MVVRRTTAGVLSFGAVEIHRAASTKTCLGKDLAWHTGEKLPPEDP